MEKDVKIDINSLPKEVLFNLLLLLNPNELSIVCKSHSNKIREICKSEMFREKYKKRYPRKLMTGKITYYHDDKNDDYVFKDSIGNIIKIEHDGSEILRIRYIPYRQHYKDELAKKSPISISLYKTYEEETVVTIYRDKYTDPEESKILLFLLEKDYWGSGEPLHPYTLYKDISVAKDFHNSVREALIPVKIGTKYLWQILRPFDF